jgi:zinc protease
VIPVIERTSVDGVTVLRSDAAFGRYAAGLVFRVGRFDEALPSAGLTHLVEHLTLRGRHKAAYQFNAQVTGLYTTFIMESAEPGDVADYVAVVCQGLAADHSEGLQQEKRVLRTEAASRGGGGALGACLVERYGAAGPGLYGYSELGLHRLDWAEIDAWRRRWFTAGNAVLWISGPVPPGLRIDLPAGEPVPPDPVRPLGVPLPGCLVTRVGGMAMSMVAPRSAATSMAVDVIEQRCTEVLRHERGLSYGVTSTAEPVDATLMHAWLAADALTEQLSSAAHAMLSTAEEIAANGARAEEIADYARRMRQSFESVGGGPARLHRHAERVLLGDAAKPARQPADLLRRIAEMDGAEVGAAAGGLLGSLIVATPQQVPAVLGRMPPLPAWPAETGTVDGQPVTSLDGRSVLTAGAAGVTYAPGDADHRVTVRYDSLAAMLCWNDQKRTLIGADGFALVLDPAQWPDGAALVASVTGRVRERLRVPLDSPGPKTARPVSDGPVSDGPVSDGAAADGAASEPPAQARPARSGPVPRASTRGRRLSIVIVRIAWLVVLLAGVVVAATGDAIGWLYIVAGAAGCYRWHTRLRRWVRKRFRYG